MLHHHPLHQPLRAEGVGAVRKGRDVHAAAQLLRAHGAHQTTLRIVHLHHNVPGVLARLNQLFATHNMNIGSQTLATRGQLGYVVTDVQGEKYEGLLADLEALDETVRVRVLC